MKPAMKPEKNVAFQKDVSSEVEPSYSRERIEPCFCGHEFSKSDLQSNLRYNELCMMLTKTQKIILYKRLQLDETTSTGMDMLQRKSKRNPLYFQ